MPTNIIDNLLSELSKSPQVEAITLGGSRATNHSDQKSDYDVYVYITDELEKDIRRNILKKYCTIMEIGNHYWEVEDNCTLNNGVDIDIIYRSIDEFEKGIESVVKEYHASNGYTTCMWHNLLTCKIIYDKEGRIAELQEHYTIPYPKPLKHNIIEKNRKLLHGVLPSYDLQIKKAIQRKDYVSINHRVTEFLASYFDIVFAINEMTHPGEKRLIQLCKSQCRYLPERFEENLMELFQTMFDGDCSVVIETIVTQLDKLLENNPY